MRNLPPLPVKILMVYTANMNLGDTVLADNDRYLLHRAMASRPHEILDYDIACRDIGQIRYVDAVFFAGGILKATTENFWLYIPEILQEADRCGVPVFFSAIGVEAFYPEDEKSVRLKEALNLPCVKGISVRDDVRTLEQDYITNPDIQISSVYDPAVWCRQTYADVLEGVTRSETVGLGVVRDGLFEDYGNPQIHKQFQLDLWKGIAQILDDHRIPWQIFTNGDRRDEAFAAEVLDYIGHGEKAPVPKDAGALVSNIATYKAVLAGRMHSNIVAYSLGIPSVGFIWNQKLSFWADKIGYPERFLAPEEMTAENAVDRLLAAMQQGCQPKGLHKWGVFKAIREFADQWCHVKPRPKPDFRQHLFAPSLGCIDLRYRNTNSVEAFAYSLAHGFVNFQLDLRLTEDDALVCVNRWHPDTYKMMYLPVAEDGSAPALSLEAFQRCKYYNRISTATFDEFLEAAADRLRTEELTVVLRIGRPSEELRQKLLENLRSALERYALPTEKFILCLERKSDLVYLKTLDWDIPAMYYMVVSESQRPQLTQVCRKAIALCNQMQITHLAMGAASFGEQTASLCRASGIKSWVFSYRKTEQLIAALETGADMVGSLTYPVDYLERLT